MYTNVDDIMLMISVNISNMYIEYVIRSKLLKYISISDTRSGIKGGQSNEKMNVNE